MEEKSFQKHALFVVIEEIRITGVALGNEVSFRL